MKYRTRRELLSQAFDRALRGDKAGLIDLTPITGMSVDTVFIIIRKTEFLRDKYGREPGRKLRRLVRQAAVASGLPHDRRYAYEVVVMNYYGIIKGYVTDRRKELTARRAARKAAFAHAA